MDRWFSSGRWRRPAAWLLGASLLLIVALYGLRALKAESHAPIRLVVYAFSTQEEVYSQGIFPAFESAWEAETGREVSLEGVFGASGTLAGQINLGAPADVVVFSNAEHVDWLKVGKRVRPGTEPAIVGCSPMVIVARPGLAVQVREYADLAQPGLDLLHADPRSSGAGQWAVLAEYGSAYLSSRDEAAATAQLRAIWKNVRLLADSARAQMTLYELGAGDALVTYEQDALMARERGVEMEIALPAHTIVAQHAAVIVDDNVTRAERAAAEAFIRFLLGEPGQQVFGRFHLRQPDCRSEGASDLPQPFTVEDLGGWSQAYSGLVQGVWQAEVLPELELEPAPALPNAGGQ